MSICSSSLAELHGTLTATTNNADRWFSKSENDFALIANLDYEHASGLYIGSSISNIDFNSEERAAQAAHVEATPYLGWSFALPQQWRLDLQWTGYLYDGEIFGRTGDYHEFYVFLNYRDYISSRISGTPDYYGLSDYALDFSLSGRYPLTDALHASASFGYTHAENALGASFPYWSVGLSYAYKFVTLGVRYMDADEIVQDHNLHEAKYELYDVLTLDSAFVFSISTGF